MSKSDKKQMLLILDGHSTHTKNIEAIKLAREYGIIMLSLPAHTSHRLQPLDKSFFKSLKYHFNEASESWMRTHPSSVIKQADIAGLLGVAYPRAASMATVLHGFEACGLWPPDRHKIREEDYVPMETSLDKKEGILEENDEEIRDTVISGSVNTHAESSENRSLKANTGQVDPFDNPQPSTSSCAIIQSNSPNLEETVQLPVEKLSVQKLPLKETTSACAANKISKPKDSQRLIRSHLQELSPIPRLNTVQNKLSKGATASQVLTESPYKNDLEKKIDDKNKKKVKLDLNKENRGKVGSSKRNKSVELKTVVRKKKKASESSEDEEWYCIICDENTKESMIQCTACKFWIHDLCAGVNKGAVAYQCDNCSSYQSTN